jgi:hypothetical protein
MNIRRENSACALLAFSVLMTARPSLAQETRHVPIGVNVVNPQRYSAAQQDELIDQLIAAGVKTIRVPLPPKQYSADAVRFVEAASSRNLQILLILSIEFPPDSPVRPADPRYSYLYSGPPLSAADPLLFKVAFSQQLAAFEQKNIRFRGFELGNEINWAAFNPDFPIPGEQKTLSEDDLKNDGEGRRIAEGFRRYVAVLKVLKEIRDQSTLNGDTPIITAGLADPGPAGPRPGSPADAVSIAAAVGSLQSLGADKIADAIGIHSYMPVNNEMTPADYKADLKKNPLSACGPKLHCWITEWGLSNNNTDCPVDDAARAQKMSVARRAYDELMADGTVTGLFYFAWNTEPWSSSVDPLSIYRCGGLSRAGQVATAPR